MYVMQNSERHFLILTTSDYYAPNVGKSQYGLARKQPCLGKVRVWA